MHCSYSPARRTLLLKTHDVTDCRSAVRLSSDSFPIDAILQHNERVVESAKKTIRETREIIARATRKRQVVNNGANKITSLNTWRTTEENLISSDNNNKNVFNTHDIVQNEEQTSLPNISQFFEPLDTHAKKHPTRLLISNGGESVFINNQVREHPPLLSNNQRMDRNINDIDVHYDGRPIYRRPSNSYSDDKETDSSSSNGIVSPKLAPILVSPVDSRSGTSESALDKLDIYDELGDKSVDMSSLIPLRKQPNDSDTTDTRGSMNSVISKICGQFKEHVENIFGKQRFASDVENRNLIGFEQSLVKEIKRAIVNRDAVETSTPYNINSTHPNINSYPTEHDYRYNTNSTSSSPSFPDYLPKDYHPPPKDHQTSKDYRTPTNVYHRAKDYHHQPKSYPSTSICKVNHVTNHVASKAYIKTNSMSQQTTLKNKKRGYLCNQCGKVYCRKYVLKIHQRVHSGEKPLVCQVCGKCFSDPSNMKKHVKLHDHDPTSFGCKYCRRQFVTRKGLVNHLHSVHSREFVNTNCYSTNSM